MTREELIKYCRYYKGEEECPYINGSDQGLFWELERMYITNTQFDEDDAFRLSWEGYAQSYIDKHPNAKNLFTDTNVSIHTKGMARYIAEMVAKWNPYERGILTRY